MSKVLGIEAEWHKESLIKDGCRDISDLVDAEVEGKGH